MEIEAKQNISIKKLKNNDRLEFPHIIWQFLNSSI